MKKKFTNKQRGFVLLLAIIISTILFSIGIGMATVIYKELILAFTARESQFAFYASDTSSECVLYWDNRRGDARFDPVNPFKPGVSLPIECDGVVVPPGNPPNNLGPVDSDTKEFWLNSLLNTDTAYCVHSQINKLTPPLKSKITSWGFNSCDPDFKRRIDRAQRRYY